MPAIITPRDESPDGQFQYWRSVVGETFVPLDPRPRQLRGMGNFHAGLQTAQLGAMGISVIDAGAHSVHHTRRHITSDYPDFFKLSFQLQGDCKLDQRDRQALLHPGELALYDTRQPYAMDFDDRFRMLVLMFPRAMLRLPDHSLDRVTTTSVSCDSGLGTMVSPLLHQLADQVSELEAMATARLADNVVDFLTTLFAERSDTPVPVSEEGRAQLVRRILTYIDQRLPDPELGPAQIATAHNVSRRYLYKLMAERGSTVSGWIRARRLHQCRRDLADPALAAAPVGAIGARWGFPDPARFSHAFKAAFGASPRDFRGAVASLPAGGRLGPGAPDMQAFPFEHLGLRSTTASGGHSAQPGPVSGHGGLPRARTRP